MSTNETLTYGPQTVAVEAMLDTLRGATETQIASLVAARARGLGATHYAAVTVAQEAWDPENDLARADAWNQASIAALRAIVLTDPAKSAYLGLRFFSPAECAVTEAVRAMVVRDLISPADFGVLTGPWVEVFGPLA